MRVLITGAAGNLGSHLSRFLLNDSRFTVRMMYHNKPLEIQGGERVQADLAKQETLAPACAGVDCIVHFAGILFEPHPEKFLPTTNVQYVRNIVDAAVTVGVKKFIIVSFPHVEGDTTPENPATDRQDRHPRSWHARTRLAAEKYIFEHSASMIPISIRSGTVYGRDILMVKAAKWLSRRRLLAVWTTKTWYHFISIDDFLEATRAAILNPNARGIYNVADDRPMYIQEFLDLAAKRWGHPRPHRFPACWIYDAAAACELFAGIFGTKSPLHHDFIKIGMVNHCCDTSRMKDELLPQLKFPVIRGGISLL